MVVVAGLCVLPDTHIDPVSFSIDKNDLWLLSSKKLKLESWTFFSLFLLFFSLFLHSIPLISSPAILVSLPESILFSSHYSMTS